MQGKVALSVSFLRVTGSGAFACGSMGCADQPGQGGSASLPFLSMWMAGKDVLIGIRAVVGMILLVGRLAGAGGSERAEKKKLSYSGWISVAFQDREATGLGRCPHVEHPVRWS